MQHPRSSLDNGNLRWASSHDRRCQGRFHVRVDLRDKNFSPGKKVYDRVKWCLTDRLPLVFDFAFVWRTDDAAIAAELDKAMGIAGGKETRSETLLKLVSSGAPVVD